jgi:hypothetical protein
MDGAGIQESEFRIQNWGVQELQEFRSYRRRRGSLYCLSVVSEASRLTLPGSNLGLSSAGKSGWFPTEEGKVGRLTYHPITRHPDEFTPTASIRAPDRYESAKRA